MKKIIVRLPNKQIQIIEPNLDKFGPEYKEIMADVVHFEDVIGDVEVLEKVVKTDPKTKKKIEALKIVKKKAVVGTKEVTKKVVDKIIRPFSECTGLQPWINPERPDYMGRKHEWFLTDEDIDISDIESPAQLYCDEGSEKIKKDYGWDKFLMEDQDIKRKHLNRLQKKIKEKQGGVKAKREEIKKELAKAQPDTMRVLILQNEAIDFQMGIEDMRIEWDDCKGREGKSGNKDVFWLKKALKNLDEDGHQKPEIRKKIAERLKA